MYFLFDVEDCPEANRTQISTTHYKHFLNRTLTSFRGRTVALIYAKTLSIQAGRYDEKAAITLMSTDIDRLTTSLQSLCEIWANFIELSIGVVLLGLQIGWICVAPIIVVASMFCCPKSRYPTHMNH
jgi:ATP-binding cassette subfamily C (CFTR/MRP) protein 1